MKGKTEFCEISPELHEKLRLFAWNIKRPIQEVIRDAWEKYGISAEAIKKYLQER